MINIYLVTDNRFAELCAIVIKSVVLNDIDNRYCFYIVDDGVSVDNKTKIKNTILGFNAEISWLEKVDLDAMFKKSVDTGAWPINVLQRLYVLEQLPDTVDRIIYLDCDILVRKSLDVLYNTELGSNEYLAGVQECISEQNRRNIGMNIESPYINAGMLLIDVKKWLKYNATEKFTEYICKNIECLQYNDQDAINAVFENHIKIIHPIYNATVHMFNYSRGELFIYHNSKMYYKEEEINEAINDPTIVHFNRDTSSIRPWYKNGNHKFKNEWLEVRNQTAWADEELWEDNRSITDKLKCFGFKILPRKLGIRIARYFNKKHTKRYS